MSDVDRDFDEFVGEVEELTELRELSREAWFVTEQSFDVLPEYFVPTPVPNSVTFAN